MASATQCLHFALKSFHLHPTKTPPRICPRCLLSVYPWWLCVGVSVTATECWLETGGESPCLRVPILVSPPILPPWHTTHISHIGQCFGSLPQTNVWSISLHLDTYHFLLKSRVSNIQLPLCRQSSTIRRQEKLLPYHNIINYILSLLDSCWISESGYLNKVFHCTDPRQTSAYPLDLMYWLY